MSGLDPQFLHMNSNPMADGVGISHVCMYACMYVFNYIQIVFFLCINPPKIKKIEHIKTLNYGENTIKLPSWRHLCICFVGTLLYIYVHICVYI
jgi:hypothetical protein